jgi:AraC-like DNA-binding protein
MNPTSLATASTAGVLRPSELARHLTLVRFPAGESVAPWVENHWALRWDLPPGRHYVSQVLPHPTCSLTIEVGSHRRPEVAPDAAVVVTGVTAKRFDVDVRGWGRIVGVRFRPGALAALTGRSAADWTDRTLPAREVLPDSLCGSLSDPGLAERPDQWATAAEAALLTLEPKGDVRYEDLLAVIADMLRDRSLVSVSQVCERHGYSARTLQRLFLRYVGISPKWVLARYRMHDVVAELDAGYEGTLTDLAQSYGWYDQAHFARAFSALIGVPPRRFRGSRGRAGDPDPER